MFLSGIPKTYDSNSQRDNKRHGWLYCSGNFSYTSSTNNPKSFATTENVVLLMWLVKNMKEMSCEPYIGEQDVEIAGRWIRKVEKTMIQINIPKDLQVSCATQLLSNRVMTWWETIHMRCATKTLT